MFYLGENQSFIYLLILLIIARCGAAQKPTFSLTPIVYFPLYRFLFFLSQLQYAVNFGDLFQWNFILKSKRTIMVISSAIYYLAI